MEEDIEIEGLLLEKMNLEKRLKIIGKKIDPFLENMKAFCLEKQLRKFTWMGFDITYTRPRKYLKILIKMEQLQNAHPDWVKEHMGYERLSIKKSE